ncbi:MAG: DUF342 domain-containing protein, partial [Nitrospinae bacterium]|nr:DUF342 domain-containing protein [Nitrospinota bacterium]
MPLTLVFPGLGADRPLRTDRLAALIPVPTPVRKGAVIARPPQEGDPATPTLLFKGTVDELVGPGVTATPGATPEGKILVAARDGYLGVRDDTLVVTPLYELFRDVDGQTGDLTVTGNVRIHGGVLAGRSVTVDGDLEILGLVEGARVKASGNLLLRGGIAGGGEGLGVAGRDLLASYAQQASLEAAGAIVLEGPAMNAHLTAGKKIVLQGRASS